MVTKTDQILADQECVKLWSSTLESGYLSIYSNRLRAGTPGFDSRQCKLFLFSTASRLNLRSMQWIPGALSAGLKWQERESDHSPQISGEIKSGEAIPSLSHVYMS
jgi:hypothetical protein